MDRCSVKGCDRPRSTRGWCRMHYKRWLATGDPTATRAVGRPRTNHGACAVDGCERAAYARGWCQTHYNAWYKHGDPTWTQPEPERLFAQGYRWVYAPDHPLAMAEGRVPEHRFVLYEAGVEIPDGFHVHHRNGDKLDNRIENLEVLSPSDHARLHASA